MTLETRCEVAQARAHSWGAGGERGGGALPPRPPPDANTSLVRVAGGTALTQDKDT